MAALPTNLAMFKHARTGRGSVLGLDIGGANLKAAMLSGQALIAPFALWREPTALAEHLCGILDQFQHDRLAVTMTAELCDCFATKRQGVHAILDSVQQAARTTPLEIWSTQGRFVGVTEARTSPLHVASANWHALATFAGRFAPQDSTMLVDIGSTTTDLIPLRQGRPAPRGLTDPERLTAGELVYTGVRRTPVGAVIGHDVAREYFATMHDVYLVLGKAPPEPHNRDTADGRPATTAGAHARLARMVCDDVEHFPWPQAVCLARSARQWQLRDLARAWEKVVAAMPARPRRVIVSGTGEFLARDLVRSMPRPAGMRIVALGKRLGKAVSGAACAYALAVLAEEALGY